MTEDNSQTSHQKPPADPNVASWVEQGLDDVNVWAVAKFAVGLLILCVVAFIVLYGVLRLFERKELTAQRPPPPLARGPEERLPPQPRLQMMPGSLSEFKTPDYEMTAILDEENKTLTTYGWVNKDSGIVRIPIDEAMKRVLEKGLPSRPSPAGQNSMESGPAPAAPGRQTIIPGHDY